MLVDVVMPRRWGLRAGRAKHWTLLRGGVHSAPVLAIGEFSRLPHLTVRTLRRYHDAGLLEPHRRGVGPPMGTALPDRPCKGRA